MIARMKLLHTFGIRVAQASFVGCISLLGRLHRGLLYVLFQLQRFERLLAEGG